MLISGPVSSTSGCSSPSIKRACSTETTPPTIPSPSQWGQVVSSLGFGATGFHGRYRVVEQLAAELERSGTGRKRFHKHQPAREAVVVDEREQLHERPPEALVPASRLAPGRHDARADTPMRFVERGKEAFLDVVEQFVERAARDSCLLDDRRDGHVRGAVRGA